MKKIIFLMLLAFVTSQSFAQITDGRFEISASGTLGSFSSVYKSNGYSSESNGRLFINTSTKLGYIFYKGIEIEPELYTYFVEKGKPSFLISSNIVYNYCINEKSFYPFLLVGYGLGNSYPILTMTNAFVRMTDGFDVGCVNAGFGLKYYFTNSVGIRAEYRYQSYNSKTEEHFANNVYKNEITLNMHSVLFGFSILL